MVAVESVAMEMQIFDQCPPDLRAALREAKIEYSAAQALDLHVKRGWTMTRIIEAIRDGS